MASSNPKEPLIYCFLDTNLFLQFPTFNEIDWPQILQAKQVCLVLAPVVFRELDKHKADYSNSKRRDRARMLVSKLIKLIETDGEKLPEVRENVSLMYPNEPQINDWEAEHLVPAINDDQLIASVLDFVRQHPTEKVILLSDDSGPRVKAKTHHVRALSPRALGIEPLPDPPSPEEVENRKLREQLQTFTNRQPKFQFGFLQRNSIVKELLCLTESAWLWQTADEYMENKIRSEQINLQTMLGRADSSVPQKEVQQFKEVYERYIAKLNPALKMRYVKNYQPYCRLELALFNNGTASAHDVSIHLTFPEGSSIIMLKRIDEQIIIEDDTPEKPTVPIWARPSYQGILASLTMSDAISDLFNFSQYSTPLYHSNLFAVSSKLSYYYANFPFGKHGIRRDFKIVGHYRQEKIDPLIVYLPSSAKDGFTLTFEIIADEMLSPERGTLEVKWQEKS